MSPLARLRNWLGLPGGQERRKSEFERWVAQAAVAPKAPVGVAQPSATSWHADPVARPVRGTASVAPVGRAAVLAAFDASRPVTRRDELFGRTELLGRMLEQSIHRNAHSIVFGARGSGKTSLVRAFGDYADEQGVIVLYDECDGRANFARLMRPLLAEIPAASIDREQQAAFRTGLALEDARLDARAVARLLGGASNHRIVLILDEYDRVESREVQEEVATLLKMLSDMRLPATMVLAGIAQNATDLISAHPSLNRHLAVFELSPLSTADAGALVDRLASRVGLAFESGGKRLLAHISCGSPYHLRLFAMHAGLAACDAGAGTVGEDHVLHGLTAAFGEWESLNTELGDLFRRCAAEDISVIRDTGIVATEVARACGAGVPYERIVTLLAQRVPAPEARFDRVWAQFPSLMYSRKGRIGFEDMLAPQFLLAMLSTRPPVDERQPALVEERR